MTSRASGAWLAVLASAWLAVLVSAWLASGARADASVPESVRLTVPDCMGVSGAEVRKLAALELEPRVQVVDGADARALQGVVRCGVERVTIEVSDPERPSARSLRVEIALGSSAPEARARLLALALAELVATSRLERAALREQGADPDPDAPQLASEPASASEQEPGLDRPALRLWLAPGMSRALAPASVLFGVEAGAEQPLGTLLALRVDLQARFGSADPEPAEVAARTLSLGAALGPRVSLSHALALSLGAGARAGHARLAATPTRGGLRGDAVSGLFLGPMLVGALQLALGSQLALQLGVEGGYALRPVVGLDAQERELLALRGVWLSGSLGVALALR